jgi:hypothetical protein
MCCTVYNTTVKTEVRGTVKSEGQFHLPSQVNTFYTEGFTEVEFGTYRVLSIKLSGLISPWIMQHSCSFSAMDSSSDIQYSMRFSGTDCSIGHKANTMYTMCTAHCELKGND